MSMRDGCVQCEICSAPGLRKLVADLAFVGVVVTVIGEFPYIDIVCAACGCPTSIGVRYVISASLADVYFLQLMGWSLFG